ncbi:MAG: hypothetical protein P1U47_01100 [Zhongshania sp.]|uniref:hypothetical protein n=1 Tax=Zhongshania sp. TaxID=1971902 RepID=UPI002623D906|nr:hypothetical protein [Zhongshania sp.]MDF1690942.1 hypothetical protein [Zhongshania sp.]
MLFRGLQALGFGVLTGALLALMAWQSPARNAVNEEALIFNAENADLFGEYPYIESTLSLQTLAVDEGGRYAFVYVDGVRLQVRAAEQLLPPCVRLSELFADAVLIDNCGSYALLSLADAAVGNNEINVRPSSDAEIGVGSPAIIDLRQNPAVVALLGDYRHRLYTRPLSLRGRIKLEVQTDVTGGRRYYLAVGEDKVLFNLLALQAGDRVKAVNGVALSAVEALTDIYADLSERNQLALTLERDGRDRVLLLRY